MPIHLRPSIPIAADALLPGDPGRALALAQELIEAPKMSNHHRGLWGYTGRTGEGLELTIQSTGMGGPSAAIVLEELAGLGVRRAIRVGTCGALDPSLELGELLCVGAAVAGDGVSARLGRGGELASDAGLLERLRGAVGGEPASVLTTDLYYGRSADGRTGGWGAEAAAGSAVRAVEMEAAPLFALGGLLGVRVGCLLVVSELAAGEERPRISDEDLLSASERAGRIAVRALAAEARSPSSGA